MRAFIIRHIRFPGSYMQTSYYDPDEESEAVEGSTNFPSKNPMVTGSLRYAVLHLPRLDLQSWIKTSLD